VGGVQAVTLGDAAAQQTNSGNKVSAAAGSRQRRARSDPLGTGPWDRQS
jgi:hypothetical protein